MARKWTACFLKPPHPATFLWVKLQLVRRVFLELDWLSRSSPHLHFCSYPRLMFRRCSCLHPQLWQPGHRPQHLHCIARLQRNPPKPHSLHTPSLNAIPGWRAKRDMTFHSVPSATFPRSLGAGLPLSSVIPRQAARLSGEVIAAVGCSKLRVLSCLISHDQITAPHICVPANRPANPEAQSPSLPGSPFPSPAIASRLGLAAARRMSLCRQVALSIDQSNLSSDFKSTRKTIPKMGTKKRGPNGG
ncbi:hypothetical protein ABW21_db0203472 [Orbilia brochopaga]|nr:hypothetical protein ABW21_db0203472 [Drechslerella brochopaga]